jgi:integrase
MSLYKRGDVWWYKFKFGGQIIRESSKSTSRTVAVRAERTRRYELEHGYNGLSKNDRAILFSVAAERWLTSKRAHLAPRTVIIEQANLAHLLPAFGKKLVSDITADHISAYQAERLKHSAAPKTINLEVATLRSVLIKHRLWANLQPDVRMLKVAEDVGRALTPEEEAALIAECQNSRSRALLPAVVLALSTCMRYSEIRLLTWGQIDFAARTVKVGKSKTEAGAGRVIPLNARALSVLTFHAERFQARRREHYVFPAECYGLNGYARTVLAYSVDPSQPIGDWKEAWEAAKKRAGVPWCRFHDLRHTGCTRMLEAGVPFAVVAEVMGWSASTAIRMAKRYGHIGNDARRAAIDTLAGISGEGAQKWAQPVSREERRVN